MRVGVLVSGAGTILEAIVEAGVPVVAVLADRPCAALDRATGHGLVSELVERTSFGKDFDRAAYTHLLVDALKRHDIDVVVIAGFGTVTTAELYDAYGNRVLNTHPSLLPAFKGWHAVRAALEARVKVTGCTVHVATLEMDSGPILAQEAVPVLPDDDETSLHERIKSVERRLYPETIKQFLAELV
ncbi:MAG TPA: phosphoribosylglycinamide formyltransferase [Acidimicrobiales bacterium]|nr:phosphoribosylglycinamide formyltransferase [Acidimicrobiales bacterium]